jgi:uncharacterized protein YecT (DUF1311 family)
LAKRDIVSEIQEVLIRSGGIVGVWPPDRLSHLEWSLQRLAGLSGAHELLKYFPIGAVACVEGYFRRVIANLIDRGAPYSENALDLGKAIEGRVDLRGVLAIQQDKLTAGDLIAHLLQISSLDDVNRHMSVVLKDSFLEALRPHILPDAAPAAVPGAPEQQQSLSGPDLAGRVYADINECFRLRHIFCHEPDSRVNIEAATAQRLLESTNMFLAGTRRLVRNPNEPWTADGASTLSINDALRTRREELNVQLQAAFDKLRSVEASTEEEVGRLHEIQRLWEVFRDAQCQYRYDRYRDGSIRNSLLLLEAVRLTQARIADLERAYFDWDVGGRAQELVVPPSLRRRH